MDLKRVKFFRNVLILVIGIISLRLFYIQIIQHEEWVAKAEEQHTLENTITAKRGEIYMMDGEEPVEVVMNETVYTIVIDPMVVNREKLKEVIDGAGVEKTADWEEVFKNPELRYFVLAKGVQREKVEKIRKAAETLEGGLSGVYNAIIVLFVTSTFNKH